MTALRIDTKEFKRLCNLIRSDIDSFDADEESIYSYYRWYVKDHGDKLLAKRADPAAELRSELRVAAQAAQQFGATASQIDYIVALAVRNNNFNVMSGGRLTRNEASRIIDVMKNGVR